MNDNDAKTIVCDNSALSQRKEPALASRPRFLDGNVVYNSQAGALVFCCGIVFKVSSLPGLVAQQMQSSTLWLYLIMSAFDLVCLAAIYLFAKSGADAALTAKGGGLYRLLNAALCLYLLTKGFFYFVYTVIFLTIDLFIGVAPFVIVIVLAAPVVYTGIKGMRALARSAEIFALLLFAVMVVNLAFLDADMDFGRNLPVFALPPDGFFVNGLRFGLWLGDLFPLLFLKIKNKRLPYFAFGTGAAYSLVVIIAALAVAMYGNALPYVYNMLIRIAGFNQLSTEIGRLEWAALFVVIIMAITGLSLLFWGSAESCRRATGSPLPARILFTLLITVVPLAVPTLQDVVTFSTSAFGYAMFALALFFAAAFATAAVAYKRSRGRTDGETRRDGEFVCEQTLVGERKNDEQACENGNDAPSRTDESETSQKGGAI